MTQTAAGLQTTARWIQLTAMLIASAAIALHSPGQVSMDTSMELYEAHLGSSVSWNPPFMSALMRWLGGGELATAGLVLINSVATYLSLASITESASDGRHAEGEGGLPWWRMGLCLCLIANPVVFLYVGIVWKDVLFGSSMITGVALALASASQEGRHSWGYAVAAMLVLAATVKIRQQGIFMGPVLAALPLIAVIHGRGLTRSKRWQAGTMLVVVFIAGVVGFGATVSRTIAESGDRSSAVGFRVLMNYDIAGIVCRSSSPVTVLPIQITQAERGALCSVYASTRVDYLSSNVTATHWLDSMSNADRIRNWWHLVRAEPRAYLMHRFALFANVLDLVGIAQALPIHVGVDGNVAYLKQVGMAEQRGGRAMLVYRIASSFFGWPIYRHWFYLMALAVGTWVMYVVRLPRRMKAIGGVIALASGLFYMSYLPTGISSDFRYLYGNVLLVTALWLIISAGGFSRRSTVPIAKG
jgi:hypothetical protein